MLFLNNIVLYILVSLSQDSLCNVPTLSNDLSGSTIAACNSNFSVTCQGNYPLQWTYFPNYETESNIKISYFESPWKSSKYTATLDIQNVSFRNVNFYYCHYKDHHHQDSNASIAFYLFVDLNSEDFCEDQLSVINSHIVHVHLTTFKIGYLPCRPTAPDIHVDLYMGKTKVVFDQTILWRDFGKVFNFDMRFGFMVREIYKKDVKALNLTCVYIHRNKGNKKYVQNLMIDVLDVGLKTPTIVNFDDGHNILGDPLELYCSVSPKVEGIRFQWIYPDHTYINPNRKIVAYKNQTSKLVIESSSKYDEGNYTCLVYNPFEDASTSKTISIKIFDKNHIYLTVLNITDLTKSILKIHSNISLNIEIDAHPVPNIFWFNKNKRELINNSKKYIIIRNENSTKLKETLTITNLTYEDSGTYELSVENGKKFHHVFNLNITDKPITVMEKFYVFKPHQKKLLFCNITGNPTPEINIYVRKCSLENCTLTKIPAEISRHKEKTQAKILISTDQPFLEINCAAVNFFGIHNSVSQVFTTDIPNGFNMWYNDTKNDKRTKLYISTGDMLFLKCASGKFTPKNNLTWFKNGRKLDKDAGNLRIQTTNDPFSYMTSLYFKNISYNDAGIYKCVLGSDQVDILETKQIETVVAQSWVPRIQSNALNDNTLIVNLKVQLSFDCILENKGPNFEIVWLKDNIKLVPKNKNVKLENIPFGKTLDIFEMGFDEQGIYECEIRNEFGTVRKYVNLKLNIANDNHKGSSSTLFYGLIGVLVLIVIFSPSVFFLIKFKLEKKYKCELDQIGLSNFNRGGVESINTELVIEEQAELLPYDEACEFPMERLRIGRLIGKGAFGTVLKAEAYGIVDSQEKTIVAVKMVNGNRDSQGSDVLRTLCSELKIMVHLGKHLNIVNLLGACTKNIDKNELVMILEYCRFGDLHNYLIKHRDVFINQYDFLRNKYDFSIGKNCSGENGFDPQVTKPIYSEDLLVWSFQIARGMKYLASRNILHGDLAARNILLSDHNIVKICDFGLAKNIYKNNFYKKTTFGLFPLKWLAIESIEDRIFSIQSDVWAYGIVLWEIFSLGQMPYPGMNADDSLFNKIAEGYRMGPPEYATRDIYEVMMQCWNEDPLKRPSFCSLEDVLGLMLQKDIKKHFEQMDEIFKNMNRQRFKTNCDFLARCNKPDFKNLTTPQ